MATIGDINLNESTTVTARLAAVQVTRNSTVQSQEVMVLGSPNSTTALALAEVMGSTPASTTVGLVVRPVDGHKVDQNSTVWAVQLTQYSTTANISSVAGVVQVHTQGNSTAADYIPVRLVDSSGTGFLTPGNEYTAGSTYSSHAGPTLTFDNSSNNTYRVVGLTTPLPVQVVKVFPTLLSTGTVLTSSNSTAIYALESSAAGVRHKVYAYSLTSTETTPSTIVFMTNSTSVLWRVAFGSGSSGITGANLAISPPAWLFASAAAGPLQCVIEKGASTQCLVTLSYSYFTEA